MPLSTKPHRQAAATVAPSTSEQTVCASGVYTTGEQKVSAITPSIVGNLDASSFASSIVAAIEGKGVTVPADTLLNGMAALIESIEAGGSASGLVCGEFTMASDNMSFGLEIEKPEGFVNGSVPTLAVAYNKTYTKVESQEAQLLCRALALVASNGGVGVRYSQYATKTGGGLFDDPAKVCKWYGVKLWFYGSKDANYRAMRAGDTYGWFYII